MDFLLTSTIGFDRPESSTDGALHECRGVRKRGPIFTSSFEEINRTCVVPWHPTLETSIKRIQCSSNYCPTFQAWEWCPVCFLTCQWCLEWHRAWDLVTWPLNNNKPCGSSRCKTCKIWWVHSGVCWLLLLYRSSAKDWPNALDTTVVLTDDVSTANDANAARTDEHE